MTITVIIDIADGSNSRREVVGVSHDAQQAVRLAFNPSGLARVIRLKALAAAFISEADAVAAEKPDAAASLHEAVKGAITASMWAVHGATKGAP